ncbi:MAG: 3-hydroxyacyl-CoA dehydrogenase NAD-binding domain-containing protein [Steroidobacteraceae bacterium]
MAGTLVIVKQIENVSVVAIDNAPVNALGAHVRREIAAAVKHAETDSAVDVILIYGVGRLFSAGADIREFGRTSDSPTLPELCSQIEACRKPVIAMLHGSALGGALEIALSAHYRFALPDTTVGLPEVLLGLIPGAGGTQRLPRLIGVDPALELMIEGERVDARKALSLGLIDLIVEGEDPLSGALNSIAEIHRLRTSRRTQDVGAVFHDPATSLAPLNAARSRLSPNTDARFAAERILQAVEFSLTSSLDRGLAYERELFLQCLASPQHVGLKHAFFAQREAVKTTLPIAAAARPIKTVGIVGAGTMGAGIALAVLDAGFPVILVERDPDALIRGTTQIERTYDALIARNRLSPDRKQALLGCLTGTTTYSSLADVDLVIEAVYEDFATKRAVFAELEQVCKSSAVLATNTSYLDVNALAAGTARPADVIGLHFFSPANVMKLLEIVVTDKVSDGVIATGFEFARQLNKLPVRAGVCDGFIGNRILSVYRQCADAMLEDGASPYQIDQAIREFGFPMGPYQMADLAGGDIAWATRKRRAAGRHPDARYVQIADRLCERGWFGQKTGRGYYIYQPGDRKGVPDPEVESIIDAERKRAGINPRQFTNDEIVRRYLAAMINEGANVVMEGIARRPLDIDVVLLFGYGFPRYRGGPMKFADMRGLPNILADIREFSATEAFFWKPSPLLLDLVARDADFDSLNQLDRRHHA